jgi:hypothetical protein
MEPIHLYIKTHRATGKKYFGQTKKNPFEYPGSGKMWKEHLREHGNDVQTEVFGTFSDRDACKAAARKFSSDNDIAKSDLWLNLIPETLGGSTTDGTKSRDTMLSRYGADYYKNIAKLHRSEKREETKVKLRNHPNCRAGGKAQLGKVRLKVTCPHCGKIGAMNTMSRWHFDKCRSPISEG